MSEAPENPLAPPAEPVPTGSTRAGSTAAAGLDADPRVADALSRLAEVEGLPPREQVEVFGDIHRRLAAVLADPDSRA